MRFRLQSRRSALVSCCYLDLPSTQNDSPSPLIMATITSMGYDDGYYALKRCSTKFYAVRKVDVIPLRYPS